MHLLTNNLKSKDILCFCIHRNVDFKAAFLLFISHIPFIVHTLVSVRNLDSCTIHRYGNVAIIIIIIIVVVCNVLLLSHVSRLLIPLLICE